MECELCLLIMWEMASLSEGTNLGPPHRSADGLSGIRVAPLGYSASLYSNSIGISSTLCLRKGRGAIMGGTLPGLAQFIFPRIRMSADVPLEDRRVMSAFTRHFVPLKLYLR